MVVGASTLEKVAPSSGGTEWVGWWVSWAVVVLVGSRCDSHSTHLTPNSGCGQCGNGVVGSDSF